MRRLALALALLAAACRDGEQWREADLREARDMAPSGDLAPGELGAGVDLLPADLTAVDLVEPSCRDGIRNGDETDEDCGGSRCPPCPAAGSCLRAGDCQSALCVSKVCQPSCDDGVADGTETGTDCGGACPPCAAGGGCRVSGDCASLVCEKGVCAAARCNDAVANGDESDLDCGGSCPGCATGKACRAAADCLAGVCGGGRCAAPSCADGVRNGDESDADCGGPCARCDIARACRNSADCATAACLSSRCVATTCADGKRSGDESDLDCGGSCLPCDVGLACGKPADCTSRVCAMGACQAPGCSDGVRNGGESDVDCGGACAGCAVGAGCATSRDCKAAVCEKGSCRLARSCRELRDGQPLLGDGAYAIAPDAQGTIEVQCEMVGSDGGWTLFGHLDSGDLDYAMTVSARPGTAATSGNVLGAKPAGTVARLVLEGAGFRVDLVEASASAAFKPSRDGAYSQIVFSTLREQSGAIMRLDRAPLSLGATQSGFGCSIQGSLVLLSGGWGSTIDGHSYEPIAGCQGDSVGILWPLHQSVGGSCSYLVGNSLEMAEQDGCSNRPTGKLATRVRLYYR